MLKTVHMNPFIIKNKDYLYFGCIYFFNKKINEKNELNNLFFSI